MYWTLELASKLEDAPWPATKDELIDYATRSGAPLEVIENLEDLEDDGEVYESKNSGNARFSSLNYPQIKGGWVIIPADLFAAGYFAEGATHRFILTIDSLYEISYDPATDSYTRSSNRVKLGG